METIVISGIAAAALFVGMLLFLEAGRLLGKRHVEKAPDGAKGGSAAVESAVFALLGLLVAFTFSGAASRFDARRQLITKETNDIGTAYLRLDLLAAEAQPGLRDLFRQYLDARLTYTKLPDVEAARRELARSLALQRDIWKRAMVAIQASDAPRSAMMLIPALNNMFGIATTRTMAALEHPPAVIYYLLFVLGLGCALLAGYDMAFVASPTWTHRIALAAIIAVTFYVILDLEYPRRGFIRVDSADTALVNLRERMN